MTSNLECIIHYENQSFYGQVDRLTDINIDRINDAKRKREEVGGSYLHENQIRQIPENINKEIHGVHRSTCYKR